MVLVCFLLDLRSLSPPLLRDVKQVTDRTTWISEFALNWIDQLRNLVAISQSLLQMANFYTISSNWRNKLDSLRDRIGLCYVIKNRISSSDEVTRFDLIGDSNGWDVFFNFDLNLMHCQQLKVAYGPRGDYSLRDFHHAVNSLPTDSFSPVINESGSISCYGLALSLSQDALVRKLEVKWKIY